MNGFERPCTGDVTALDCIAMLRNELLPLSVCIIYAGSMELRDVRFALSVNWNEVV